MRALHMRLIAQGLNNPAVLGRAARKNKPVELEPLEVDSDEEHERESWAVMEAAETPESEDEGVAADQVG